MKRPYLALAALLAAGLVYAQPAGMHAGVADAPKVEIKGKIEKIHIAMGQGMPSLEIRAAGKAQTVFLGSMRYLMEQDFKPRAGDEATVRGYQVKDGIVAIAVTIRGKTLRLRDDAGFPLWMRGRHGPAAKPGA